MQAGETPLHLAASHNHLNIAALLIDAGADLTAKTHDVSPVFAIVILLGPFSHRWRVLLLFAVQPHPDALCGASRC